MSTSVVNITDLFKDVYAAPGTRLKQWVVDQRREAEWEHATCPRFETSEHEDNTGIECRNSASKVLWTWLAHDCCDVCGDLHEHLRSAPDVQEWLAEKAKRPPIEQDRTKLSDEIQADYAMAEHPMLAAFRSKP